MGVGPIASGGSGGSVPAASTTVAGKVELATNAEATTGTDTSRAVTPAGVRAAIATVVGAAPGALDTLAEIAAALDDDADFAGTITTALAGKADTASLPETIRDTIAAALVAGDNVTIDVDDTGNTITISATGGGGGPAAFDYATDRPFAVDSPINTPLGRLVEWYDHPWLHKTGPTSGFGAGADQHWYLVDASPVWVGSPTDPVWIATVVDHIDPTMNRHSPARTITFRAPEAMTRDGSGDSILLVIDGDDPNRLIEVYNATTHAETHTVTQGASGYAILDLRTSWGLGRYVTNEGVRAINSSWLAGLVTGRDIAADKIDHALVVALSDELLQSTIPYQYRWPATGWDNGQKTGPLDSGTIIGIPQHFPEPADLTPFGRKVWACLKEYGAIVGDYVGGGYTSLYYDGNSVDGEALAGFFAWWDAGTDDMTKMLPFLRVADYQPPLPTITYPSPSNHSSITFSGVSDGGWPAFWTAADGTVAVASGVGRMTAAGGYGGAAVVTASELASNNMRVAGAFTVELAAYNTLEVNIRRQAYGSGQVQLRHETNADGGGAYLRLTVSDNYEPAIVLDQVPVRDIVVGDVVHFVVQAQDYSLEAKVWFGAEPEPDEWTLRAVDPLQSDYRTVWLGISSAGSSTRAAFSTLTVQTPR